MHILIASGDVIHARMTRFLLEDVGYTADHQTDEHGVRRKLKHGDVDLVLMDEDCPDVGGYELCSETRSRYHTPIVFLSESCAVADRVRALKLGADDVLQKPYNPNELLARIEAVMRRYGDEDLRIHTAYHPITVGPLNLDPVQRRVVIHGRREQTLTEREFQLLYYLVQNASCVLSSRQLLQKVWGLDDVTDSNLVPVYIGRLRRKIEEDPLKPHHIIHVRDLGYSFRP
ncbi:MAG: response regulator transcription factor [Chloroflexaceae bacterium]|nr:response regulator transcription factor [Chloroflexaceae bacterium]